MEAKVALEKQTEKVKKTGMDLSVFGLGKVGLTLVSCLAKGGNQVTGVDVSSDLIASVNDHSIQTTEPGVIERLESSTDKFHATTNVFEAIENSSLSFIIVPTPSNTFGGFSLRYVLQAIQVIGEAIKAKGQSHVISLVSTVMPGSSDQFIIPALEKAANRKVGDGLGYCYNPSFIALGEVVKGMETPDYILIGESDKKSGDIVLEAHRSMLASDVPIARMQPIEAEITKLASNTHETMRVSFANMLMAACSEIPGANVDRITGALSHRMGKRFFKGAIPFGGPCWPRDNKALSAFLEVIGVPSRLPRNVDIFNEEHGYYIMRKVMELSPEGAKIGVIGLAYKSGTHVIECSYAVKLIQGLLAESREVVAWDPQAMEEVSRVIGDRMHYASSGDGCLDQASVIAIIQPLKELADLDWSRCKNKIVIDCWRCLAPSQIEKIGTYIPLGESGNQSKTEWFEDHLKNRLNLLTN